MDPKIQELIDMINKALTMELAAATQYLNHAEKIFGPESGPIMEQLQEQAGDEQKHAANLRTLIADYLKGVCAYEQAPTIDATNYEEIITANIRSEQEAIAQYQAIYAKVKELQPELGVNFMTLEHDIRHIMIEEAQHITELERIQ